MTEVLGPIRDALLDLWAAWFTWKYERGLPC